MKKKPVTLSDKLNKLFAPEDQSDNESGDETAPKFSEFDETPDDAGRDAALSEFRKRNVRFLEEFDRKYKGAVSSRNETFEEDEDSGEEDEDDDEDELSDDEDEEEEGGNVRKSKPKSLVLLKKPQNYDSGEDDDDDDDDEEEEEDDDESDGDDYEESTDEDRDSSHKSKGGKPQSNQQELTLIKEENRQDTINKGLAVQNQLKIWERLLEMRIKVQPCLIASNSLPPSDECEKLRSQSKEFQQKADQAVKTVSETMDKLLELQEYLLGRFSETKDLLKGGSKRKAASASKSSSKAKRMALDEYEPMLAERCKDMEEYQNGVLMKWHDRTSVASKHRNNPRQSLSVLKKIEDSLINREELVRKTQLYRGGYTLLGRAVPPMETATESTPNDRQDAGGLENQSTSIYDGEIFDDSDFYHQMLRELIEYKTSTTDSPQEIANKLAELQKLRNKMKKTVDTKASKGRKIRYVVHNKLVNFMAPEPDYDWTDEAKDELFGSLFGRTPVAEER